MSDLLEGRTLSKVQRGVGWRCSQDKGLRDRPPFSQVLQHRLTQEISAMECSKEQLLMESETLGQ